MTVPDLTAFTDLGVFTPADGSDAAKACYDRWGFVVLRGLLDDSAIDAMEAECVAAQQGVLAGELDARHGSRKYLDDESKAEHVVNYVERVEELAPTIDAALATPTLVELVTRILGPDHWPARGGVVYQDARPGRDSGYTRIGWHADWQAVPHLDIWPGTAFTIHIDATSPANGFLRVVPGSHLWATASPFENINNVAVPEGTPAARGYTDTPPPAPMPLGFEKIRGEIPVYAERGDVILHDAYLWHSAARATDDHTVRRHVRGGWHGGDTSLRDADTGFVKNAAR
ncbi:phytanoyl-CoA dioxygenase family protein [Pseudonocardia xinjiangensis]|uniref:phytanoyl-CoA dioxygenase family protein n=1 Tax=Pseudonocardia xinjiangensis TaxID=75289 RepID=UPI001B7D13A3|nr:phytanoyl-CoA dioxygenase family protein [Pseudonocardia xinjiangensis]